MTRRLAVAAVSALGLSTVLALIGRSGGALLALAVSAGAAAAAWSTTNGPVPPEAAALLTGPGPPSSDAGPDGDPVDGVAANIVVAGPLRYNGVAIPDHLLSAEVMIFGSGDLACGYPAWWIDAIRSGMQRRGHLVCDPDGELIAACLDSARDAVRLPDGWTQHPMLVYAPRPAISSQGAAALETSDRLEFMPKV